VPDRGLEQCVFAKEDYPWCALLFSQSGVEKVIDNMVNSDHGIRDTVVRVTGSWKAESEDERRVVPVT